MINGGASLYIVGCGQYRQPTFLAMLSPHIASVVFELVVTLLLVPVDAFVGWGITSRQQHRTTITIRSPSCENVYRVYKFSLELSSPFIESEIDFSESEQALIENLFEKCSAASVDESELIMLEALPTLRPSLLLKLRQAENHLKNEAIRSVSQQLNVMLNARLELAKSTLQELLAAGEIRKLDSLIGSAARTGRLDVAFFNVLTVNLQEAMASSDAATDEDDGTANRLQILKHVYTRCQEEVEKTIPPGTALLNKLLRTEQASIRLNLYEHYLTPRPNVITTPDGKEVKLNGTQPVLVPMIDFVNAIDTAVLQIRDVENAGGTDQESAAMMVEGCRQIAKEARVVIGNSFGRDSEELRLFEEGLQPVFRPSSPESPYIRGQT
jgi:hypothetical protein